MKVQILFRERIEDLAHPRKDSAAGAVLRLCTTSAGAPLEAVARPK